MASTCRLWDYLSAMGVPGAVQLAVPTGVVTFVLTDVEGSTRMWEEAPEAMAQALDRHYQLLDEAIARHGGVRPVEQGEGDSVVAAFTRASDALAAAVEAQLALRAESWPEGGEIRVRMGVHTGQTHLRGEHNYVGPTINRCARLRALARGGQIVVSRATRERVHDALPRGATLADLGERSLKGIDQPERLYGLLHPDLGGAWELPAPPHNLPQALSPFVGRERELAEIAVSMDNARLVTLTGPGGVGKTRLALECARRRLIAHPDGTFLAELSQIENGSLLDATLLGAVGVHEEPDRPAIDALIEHLRDRTALLLLDNCEHVIDAAGTAAARMLESCPLVRILATSREPLLVRGEQIWSVPGLAGGGQDADAPRLFSACAARARAGFELDDRTALQVEQICRTLDGMPLAIELAAARIRVLGLEQIEAGLGSSLQLLSGGPRSAAERHRTLRASLEWSHRLLGERERLLYRRLGVFAGGWTLADSEVVCADAEIDADEVLDLLMALIDKSMVLMEETGDQLRYRMLVPVRQHAVEMLDACGEGTVMRDRHRERFANLVCRATAEPEFDPWLPWFDAEAANLRAAIDYALVTDPYSALSFAGGMARYWDFGGHYREGLETCRRVLDAAEDGPAAPRAVVLAARATLEFYLRDHEAAFAHAQKALSVAHESDEDRAISLAAQTVGAIIAPAAASQAVPLLQDAVERARRVGHRGELAWALIVLGLAFSWQDDIVRARAAIDEAVTLSRDRAVAAFRELVLVWANIAGAQLDEAFVHARRGAALAAGRVPLVSGFIDEQLTYLRALRGNGADVLAEADSSLARAEEGSPLALSALHVVFAFAALATGDLGSARRWAEPVLNQPVQTWRADSAVVLGAVELAERRPAAARERAAVVRAAGEQMGHGRMAASADLIEGIAALDEGDVAGSRRLLQRSLAVQADRGYRLQITDTLEGLGAVAAAEEDWAVAARMLAAGTAARAELGIIRTVHDPQRWEGLYAAARSASASDWDEGAALSLEQAVAYARQGVPIWRSAE